MEEVERRVVQLEEGDHSGGDVKQEVLAEIRQRDEKKENLIMYGVEEPTGQGVAAKEEDEDRVDRIAKLIGISFTAKKDAKFMYRIGKRDKINERSSTSNSSGEKGPRPRPLMVGFRSFAMKEAM